MNELETYYPPPDERVFAVIPGLINKLGWEPRMKAYLENFFSEQNRTPNWQDRGGLYSLLEPFFKMVANQTVEGVSGEFDPMGTVMGTYGGPNAKFPPKTGRFSNMADKMERFEISDLQAKLKPNISIKDTGFWEELPNGTLRKLKGVTLDNILEHPKLFKQYPDIANIRMIPQEKSGASYVNLKDNPIRSGEEITIGNERTLPNLLHEIQHAIQEKEGFARGGSVTEFGSLEGAKHWVDVYSNKVKELTNKVNTAKTQSDYARFKNELLAAKKTLAEQVKYFKEYNPYADYQRLSGEIEARDAAARMSLSGQQRRKTAPYTSEDIPLNEWITRK